MTGRRRSSAIVAAAVVVGFGFGVTEAEAHNTRELPPLPGETVVPAAVPDERQGTRFRDVILVATGGVSVAAGLAASSAYRRRAANSGGEERPANTQA